MSLASSVLYILFSALIGLLVVFLLKLSRHRQSLIQLAAKRSAISPLIISLLSSSSSAHAASLSLPCAVVDLSAFEANVSTMLSSISAGNAQNIKKRKIRIATKSVRCVQLLSRMVKKCQQLPEGDGLAGLMTFSAAETLALVKDGRLIEDDGVSHFLLCYPIGDLASARDIILAQQLANSKRSSASSSAAASSFSSLLKDIVIAVMIDSIAHIELLDQAMKLFAPSASFRLAVWLDQDMSYRPYNISSIHLGVRRSPLRSASDISAVVSRLSSSASLRLDGLMGYEAQIAGLPDYSPVLPSSWIGALESLLKSTVKSNSLADIRVRRPAALLAAAAAANLSVKALHCNGGGSGSIEETLQDASVTEVTIGSGALCGHLFDGYSHSSNLFLPSLHILLRATRVPLRNANGRAQVVTCAGGGWSASGEAGQSRLPRIVWPEGARYIDREGGGEVQTPVVLQNAAVDKGVGQVVVVRPTKSGESGEIFRKYVLVSRGEKNEQWTFDVVNTYRGDRIDSWSGEHLDDIAGLH
jgi:D-serine deaminase-like pyridoxal phosphate-dependent protein